MTSEKYTPGHSEVSSGLMAKRKLDIAGAFFEPYLKGGFSVLDCGCGPGTITQDIAKRVAPGKVVGIDLAESQIEIARKAASEANLENLSYDVASCYELPFKSASIDRVFCNALMQHLSDPIGVMKEWFRILKSGGIVGVSATDAGGLLLSPPSPELSEAVRDHMELVKANGGDPVVGRKLGILLMESGFQLLTLSARYECTSGKDIPGEYLARPLEKAGNTTAATVFKNWHTQLGSLFAVPWVSAIGVKP